MFDLTYKILLKFIFLYAEIIKPNQLNNMQYKIKFVLTILGVFFFVSIFGQTYTLTDADVVVTDGIIQSCSANLANKDVVIPSTLDGQTVTGIFEANWDGGVFRNKGIKSLVLPTSIQTIGAWAFAENNIETVNFTQLTNLKKIGNVSFDSNKLTAVDLSKCINLEIIDGNAFYQNSISSLDLSGCVNLNKILFLAFSKNQLSSINLSGCPKLAHIGKSAFAQNILTTFNLPFYQQNNREVLYWTDAVSSYANGGAATNLDLEYNIIFKPSYVPVAGELTVVDGAITGHKIDFTLHPDIIIPETYNGMTITAINRDVFKSAAIQSIALPSSLISLEYGVFGSSALLYIDLTNCVNLKIIGGGAFSNSKITNIDFSKCSGLEKISSNAFYSSKLQKADFSGCPNLKIIEGYAFAFGSVSTLTFPTNSKLEFIGASAFQYCKLSTLDLSTCTNLASIGASAFASNSISSFVLPISTISGFQGWKDNANKIYAGGETTTNVGSYFRIIGSYTLTDEDVVVEEGFIKSCSYSFLFPEVSIPSQLDGQTIVGIADGSSSTGIFYNKGITGLVLPNTLKYIGKFAFYNNNISSINFNELINLESICEYTFSTNAFTQLDFTNCSKLKLIDRYAFFGNSLKSITFPLNSTLTKIGSDAFRMNKLSSIDLSNCINLKEIVSGAFSSNNFSNFVLPINTGSTRQFVGWNNGSTILPGGSTVSNFETTYKAVFSSSYTPEVGELVVKKGVVVSQNINIDENPEIVIPSTYNGETIIGIGAKLFSGSNIESITLPSSLININDEAFRNCMLLTKLDISQCDKLQIIGKQVFSFCKLTKLDLTSCPALETILNSAFSQNNISSLDFSKSSKLEIIGDGAFTGNPLQSVDLAPCTNLKMIGSGAFAYSQMSGFKLPKPTINGEEVTLWINGQNQTFNSESVVSDLYEAYFAKLNRTNVYSIETSIEFGIVDRGKTSRKSFNLFNQGQDTLYIQDLILPEGYSVLPFEKFIAPKTYWRQYVTFAPIDNKDYEGEFQFSFRNVPNIVTINAHATVNPTYDIQFTVHSENGTLLTNALVTINGTTSMSTDSSGVATFQYVLPNETLGYTVEAKGYFTKTGTIRLNQHQTQTVTLEQKDYPVNFIVTSNNQPIAEAAVSLEGYGNLVTNSEGFVSFPKVIPQDSIPFSIAKNGYLIKTGTITVVDRAIEQPIELILKTYELTITCNYNEKPVAGVSIQLFNNEPIFTNNNGEVIIKQLSATDTLQYSIQATGFKSQNGQIIINGEDQKVIILLLPEIYQLTFNVTDGLSPIIGAVVAIPGLDTINTNTEGKAIFDVTFPEKPFNYVINAKYYVVKTGSIEVKYKNTNVDVLLEKDLSVRPISVEEKFKVHPNPASSHIEVTCEAGRILVFSTLSGKTLKKICLPSNHETIDVSDLEQGVYILNIDQFKTKLTIVSK